MADKQSLQTELPYFQQLQQQLTAFVRDPIQGCYAPAGEKPIEERRLRAYGELFFNNFDDCFRRIFPVCVSILGQSRWTELVREFVVKHRASTPLFHEIGEEFVSFLNTDFSPKESDPDFLLELAHYEWIELALLTSPLTPFSDSVMASAAEMAEVANLDRRYQLSQLAWPLAYQWPVHELSADYRPTEIPAQATTLLIYRHTVEAYKDEVSFMQLSPLLYQWLCLIEENDNLTAREAFRQVAAPLNLANDVLEQSAQSALSPLLSLKVIAPL